MRVVPACRQLGGSDASALAGGSRLKDRLLGGLYRRQRFAGSLSQPAAEMSPARLWPSPAVMPVSLFADKSI